MHYSSVKPLLHSLSEHNGSDLYLTVGYPPSVRVDEQIKPLGQYALSEEEIRHMLEELVDKKGLAEFENTLEYNTAVHWSETARFRVNAFRQRQNTGIVIRRIQTDIPTIDSLELPSIYKDMIMEKRGLVLVVGPTGSGKSTSLAAMLGHRNRHGFGHIITIEDPVEFVHAHEGCIITQRDIGIDTHGFTEALKNAFRQRPDVVLIGEIRDTEAMEQAINFAETGHLCVATLHANNANQAIERIINFFPEEKHRSILLNLAMNLRGILSQRLVLNKQGKRSLAVEVMLNRGHIRDLIQEGKVREIKELMEKSRGEGMRTFDQSLLELFLAGKITQEVAVAEADNAANMRMHIKQNAVAYRQAPRN